MASSKKPTYKVETKLAIEKKRRKSDLVVMWQSIWYVTAVIGRELWMTLIRMWELIQIWFSSSERFLVHKWLEKYLPYVPDDFSDSWRDGRLLAHLLNKLQPGCFPDAHQLDPDYSLKNVYKVFDVLESYFGIKPNVSVEEIVTCADGSDAKLLAVFLELMNQNECQPEKEEIKPEIDVTEHADQCCSTQSCIAKGTGLAVGFLGKLSSFIIFCSSISDMDIVIEIKGPTTICSERITKRSPKKKRPVTPLEYSKPISRSVSHNGNFESSSEENYDFENIIPLQYEIRGNQLSFCFKPKEKGHHKLTILWHGQHVSDSPYQVVIEDPAEINSMNREIHLKSALKCINEFEERSNGKISVKFQESQVKHSGQKKSSVKVRSKRVLNYIVKINGKDVPVNAESLESLATELLKMEYDFEKCPSFHRRNSWGFAGDAERKRSVIRQFGVDVKELEAQVSQRRSNSLTLNTRSKKSLEKSDSLESLPSRLNIVTEDILECCEKNHNNESEADFAFINEDVNSVFQYTQTKNEEKSSRHIQKQSYQENISLNFSHECNDCNSEENLVEKSSEVVDSDKISSLSTEILLKKKVDNLNDDHQISFSVNTSAFDSSCSTKQPVIEADISCMEPVLNSVSYTSLDSQRSKDSLLKGDERLVRNIPQKKKMPYAVKCNCICGRKRSKKIPHSVKKEALNTKSSKNRIVILPAITIFKKQSRGKGCTKEFKKIASSAVQHNNETEEFSTEDVEDKDENTMHENNEIYSSNENSDPCVSMLKERVFDSESNNLNPSLQAIVSKNSNKGKSKEVPYSFVNITNHTEKMKNTPKISKETEIQPKTRTLIANDFSRVTPISAVQVETADRAITPEDGKPLIKTHSLVTLRQFSFKQFNPASECNAGPVKSQIEQWENSLPSGKRNMPLRRSSSSETEQGNVKEKLAFWENTYKAEQNSSKQSTVDNNTQMNGTTSKQGCQTSESDSNGKTDDLHGTGATPSFQNRTMKEQTLTANLINKESNTTAKKDADDKLSSDLQLNSYKSNKRSFSDPGVPGVLESVNDIVENSTNSSFLESSSKEQLSSSNDDNIKDDYSEEDESDISLADSFQRSSEDEYIDDEIQERASEYWGDLGVLKGMDTTGAVDDYSFWGEQILQSHYQSSKSFPEECKVFGIAAYYGYVAQKNRFQVFTGDAGFGNLSVSMQGISQHDVSLVSVNYVRNYIYEVTYQVMTAGYYLISIRWMDRAIPGSPFVCRVTY